jgi:hypothetical protein
MIRPIGGSGRATVARVEKPSSETGMTKNRRKQRLEGHIGLFVQQYARKHYRNQDPNDRRYDRKVEQIMCRMKPEELDELMHGEGDGEPWQCGGAS